MMMFLVVVLTLLLPLSEGLGGVRHIGQNLHKEQASAANAAETVVDSPPRQGGNLMRRERRALARADGGADGSSMGSDAQTAAASSDVAAAASAQATVTAAAIEAEAAALSRRPAAISDAGQLLELTSSVVTSEAAKADIAHSSGGVSAASKPEMLRVPNNGSYASMPPGAEGLQGARGDRGPPGPAGKSRTFSVPGSASEAIVADTVILQIVLMILIYIGVKRKVGTVSASKTAVNDLDAAKELLASKAANEPPMVKEAKEEAPEVILLSGVDEKYTGEYRIHQVENNVTGYPIWKRVDSTDFIFSGRAGRWLFGDEDELAENFNTNTGNFASEKHEGKAWPHQMTSGWRRYDPDANDGEGDWLQCPELRMTTNV